MSSTFGTLFRVTTFGESHCRGVGAVVDGCPAGLRLGEDPKPTASRSSPARRTA
jgi:chorismate synthase